MSWDRPLLRIITRVRPLRRVRASVVCVDGDELLCVRLRDPVTRRARLFVPGGAIEAGEAPSEAALRETLEETGCQVRLKPEAPLIARYPFRWAGIDIDCTTHFFRAELATARGAALDRNQHEPSYNEAWLWLPLARLNDELGFHPQIHAAVAQLAADLRSGRAAPYDA